MNFVAIDFETAENYHICSVGMVEVKNGQIVDEKHILIQPPGNKYFYRNIEVHGITPEDTANAPTFEEVYPEIKKMLYCKTVVAHNESFDRNVLKKTMQYYDIAYADLDIPDKWECTLRIYRAKGYKPANLAACCRKHNIQLKHHDALSDARACAKLYLIK